MLPPPPISHTPSSGWSQCSQTQSTRAHTARQWPLERGWHHLSYRYTESIRAP